MSYKWKNILIHESDSVLDALNVINHECFRAGLVINKDETLAGIVTDGDVRRGILNGYSLNAPVSEVMNKNPTTMPVNSSTDELIEVMTRLDLMAMPLVDDENRVAGLQTLHDTLIKPVYENPVFIMAGGFGTRLRPLTNCCPKPMLKVGEKPMLETMILNFKHAGFHNFYISTHYLPDVIQQHFGNGDQYDVSITYVHEDSPLGTGGALGLLPEVMSDLPMVLINGDVLTSVDFSKVLKFHNDNHAAATMCVRLFEYQIPYGVIESCGAKITGMTEKPIQKFLINAGIYILGRDIVKSVNKNECIDMPSLLERSITEGKNILEYSTEEYWLDVGRIDDFKKAQIDFPNMDM